MLGRISAFYALLLAGGLLATLHTIPPPAAAAADHRHALERLIIAIEADVKATSYYLNKTTLNPRVFEALRQVPRHEFVAASLGGAAYQNRPLPIGHGQTISQPYIVAVMTDLLAVGPEDTVLEVGTGSGYQAAILAEMVKEVYSIEIIEPLWQSAEQRLRQLGYDNVRLRFADGYYGWAEKAPFDAIMVTAAVSHIPPPLLKQLKAGGRMIIPVGGPFMLQHLVLVEKDANGASRTRQLLPVRFVPLTGGN